MHSHLAYTRATRPTGRELGRALGFTSYGISAPSGRLDLLVRWGSRRLMPRAKLVINKAGAIEHSADKYGALRTMQKAGISVIPHFATWEQARAASNGGVIMGRKRLGMGGKNIVIYEPHHTEPQFEHDWFSVYCEPTREVRIHVVGGEIIRVQGKYNDFPELAERNPYIRNYMTGYRFRAPRLKLHSRRKEQAIKAVRALGLDFGAVDMLLFGDDRESMILEVNTAPACSPMTLSAYAEAISRLIPFSKV